MEPNQAPAAPAPEVTPAPAPQPAPAPAAPAPQVPAPEPAPQAAPAPANQTTDDDEWDKALTDFSLERGLVPEDPAKKEGAQGEQTKPAEGGEAGKTPEAPGTGEAQNAKPGEGDDAKAKSPEDAGGKAAEGTPGEGQAQTGDPVRDARAVQREIEADRAAVVKDVRETMFSDVQTQLTDADGDPINTIEDVMRLQNPNTGKAFTEEEAGLYLLQAQQHINRTRQETEQKIERIAEVNLGLKDKADAVREKYGELLKTMPERAKKIYQQYQATLVKDPKTGIIIDAPVDIEEFYDVALEPHAEIATKTAETKAAEEAKAKAEAEAARLKAQGDRGDIVGAGPTDTKDDEEKEWEAAAKDYYGGL